ncbi:polycystic kidney disease 1 like 1, partial [Astyanax mexicanus]
CSSAVQIYTEKQAYATGTDVTFLAVTEENDPLEFHWNFGDSNYIATTSRTFIKNFLLPDRYNVSVCVSDGLRSVRSEIYHVVIQTPVQVNRLLYTPSVLLDTPVIFNCRINAGSEVSYLWDFGDETQQVGKNTEHHLFNRTGEFMVKVTVFNLVSAASLKGHLFVVFEPCQPPPVKNMGPSKIQVWRYQSVSLAVTFESQIQCNISRGLLYTWTLYNPAGLQLHVPHIQTDRQDLELPKYLLQYGTYKAVAKVQIVGSIVYSNYSVQIEVMSSPPVSIINGGTNVFISRNNNSIITLDGQKSYDPDFPDNLMSYRWRCHLVNSVERSCFRENIPDTSAVLTFPASALQPDCDLFKFTLTVHSANRSSSSHTFITVRSKPTSITHISCTDCKGNSVSWNQQFSVTAVCENCPGSVTYSWKLYLVNSSSKIVPDGKVVPLY